MDDNMVSNLSWTSSMCDASKYGFGHWTLITMILIKDKDKPYGNTMLI